jgi:hypothetical protein
VTLAYCYRSGEIEFCATNERPPEGTIEIARSELLGMSGDQFRETIDVLARHGYQPGIILVPGVPEAETGEDALEALENFVDLVQDRAR